MTEPTAGSTSAPVAQASFWSDVIEIFVKPADVFRRRQFASMWPAALFVAVAVGVIFYFSFDSRSAAMDAEFARGFAKLRATNPNLPPDAVERMRGVTDVVTKYTLGVMTLIGIFLIGFGGWLLGKILGSKQTFHAALVVAAWSNMPRILDNVVAAALSLILDPAKLTSHFALTLSAAQFMNVESAPPWLYQLAGRFDLFTMWVVALLAVGFYVTGHVTKQRAVLFGVLFWVLGGLPAIVQALHAP